MFRVSVSGPGLCGGTLLCVDGHPFQFPGLGAHGGAPGLADVAPGRILQPSGRRVCQDGLCFKWPCGSPTCWSVWRAGSTSEPLASRGKAVSHALWVLEASARAQILNMGLQRWFALQLELIGGAMLLCVSVMIVLQTDAHLGMSGLSLTYAQASARAETEYARSCQAVCPCLLRLVDPDAGWA